MNLRLWDVRLHKQLLSLPHSRLVGIRSDDRWMAAALTGRRVQLWDCVPSRAYRVLHGHNGLVRVVAFSPDSRWLASAGFEDYYCIWDAATGRLAAQPVDRSLGVLNLLWEPAGDALITYSRGGMRRWPFRASPTSREPELRIDPAENLLPRFGESLLGEWSAFGKEQRFLGLSFWGQGSFDVIEWGNPSRQLWTGRWPAVNSISGSPDGRWVATGTVEGGSGVCIWDTRSGRLEQQWPIGDAQVAFSPDGRWLAATTGRIGAGGAECRTWRAGSWEAGPQIPLERMSSHPPPLAFTPDGKILAVVHGTAEVRLLNADTLEDIAILTPPDSFLITWLAFNPDGTQLATSAGDCVQMWDLRFVRQELKALGLDWNAPPMAESSGR